MTCKAKRWEGAGGGGGVEGESGGGGGKRQIRYCAKAEETDHEADSR